MKFNTFEESETYFAKVKDKTQFESDIDTVKDVLKNRLLSQKKEIGNDPFAVTVSFRDFGPSAINISMTITGTNGPNGMQGQSSIQINPFGYYMGQVTSTVSNVTTTSNTVSFYTAITNTTSLEVAGVPIGSITQTMGANVTYNSDSGQMSFKITSSQAYK